MRAFVEPCEGAFSPGREMELTPPPVSGSVSAPKETFCFQLLDLACDDGWRDPAPPVFKTGVLTIYTTTSHEDGSLTEENFWDSSQAPVIQGLVRHTT